MKKLFALFFAFTLMIAISVVSAETTSSTTTISISDDGVIEKAISPENSTTAYVLQKLEEYAKALQVPAEHLYKVLVKQQKVNSIVDLCTMLFALILLAVSIKLGTHEDAWEDGPNLYSLGCLIGSIVSIIILIAGFISMSSIIGGFINPEYGAINKLLEILKGCHSL